MRRILSGGPSVRPFVWKFLFFRFGLSKETPVEMRMAMPNTA